MATSRCPPLGFPDGTLLCHGDATQRIVPSVGSRPPSTSIRRRTSWSPRLGSTEHPRGTGHQYQTSYPLVPFTQPPPLSTQPPPNPTNSRPFPESCRRIGQCLPMFDPSVATCLLQCLCVSPFTSLKAASRTVTSLARREIITAPCSASLLLHAKWGERTRKAVR